MKEICFIIFSVLFFCSCSKQKKEKIEFEQLVGTIWKCKIDEDCFNVYEFKVDSTFIFLSCEMEDEYFGNFYFKDGFLMLHEKGSIGNESRPEFSSERTEPKLYKVSVEGNKLRHLSMSNWENDKWVPSDFKLDEDYIYIPDSSDMSPQR